MPTLQRIVQILRSAVVNPTRQALEAAVLYMLLCSTYILVSGYLAIGAAANPQQLYMIVTIKGIACILVTGALFFAISYLRCRKIRRHEETIIVQKKALIQTERRLVVGYPQKQWHTT